MQISATYVYGYRCLCIFLKKQVGTITSMSRIEVTLGKGREERDKGGNSWIYNFIL